MPLDNVLMEGVRIIFRNFSGKEGKYNREGDRNFAVLLDDKTAHAMAEDNWNVKWLKPREGRRRRNPAGISTDLGKFQRQARLELS
jgi:hypothetical protein